MRLVLLLFFGVYMSCLPAQKYDYIWKTGYGYFPNSIWGGGVDINFNTSPPDTNWVYRRIDFLDNSATVCDAQGNFLFSSNGCVITGSDDLNLINGDSINPGYYFNEFCDTTAGYSTGYPTVQDIFFLPHPADTNLYYLVHAGVGYWEPPQGFGGMNEHLYYTLLDKRLDNGRGDVVLKNQIIVHDTMSMSSISAVRHANGEDWWIITNQQRTDNYIFVRLDAEGFYESHRQEIGGFSEEDGATGQNNFSPDGNWFARFGRANGLILYHFNRCEGSLHEPLYDEVPMAQDSSITTGGVVFSPDSRMLYLITNLWIDQYDLWADDVIGSKMRVATWDGTQVPPSNLPTFFYLGQLGPDGKIYISTINTTSYLHVIESPNERGFACNVNQASFELPAFNGRLIPYFPNYRLGALGPGGCDSLLTGTRSTPKLEKIELRLAPNPTRNWTRVVLEAPAQPNDWIVVRDVYGREILRQAAAISSIDTSLLLPEVYYVEYWRLAKVLTSTKLIKG
ncbi:MAG: hypothetical protein AAGJ93_03910 [Bacteroidota bacterium]